MRRDKLWVVLGVLGLTIGVMIGTVGVKTQTPPVVRLIGADRCGTGLVGDVGSQQVIGIAEAVVWRAGNSFNVPERHLWITAANPLEIPQNIVIRTLGLTAPTKTWAIAPGDQIEINIGDAFVPAGVSASFGLEIVWDYHGYTNVISWDAGLAYPAYPLMTIACLESWRNPYTGGGE